MMKPLVVTLLLLSFSAHAAQPTNEINVPVTVQAGTTFTNSFSIPPNVTGTLRIQTE
jgi:hypothetical protein